jgi:FkbM family methyltransferase
MRGKRPRQLFRSFGKARVFAFEPHPVTFSRLVQRLGGDPRVAAHNLALSNANGFAPFFAKKVRFVYVEFKDMSPRASATGVDLISISDLLAPFGFRFVATYPDYMEIADELHVGANALFVLPPSVAE